MPTNGKTADQMRAEFYEALRQERAERHEAARRFEEEMRRRQVERDRDWKRVTGEMRQRQAERDRDWKRVTGEMRQRQVERDREHAEWKERQAERDREWKRITGEWGRFTNDEGGMVEYEGVAALRQLKEIGGMPVTAVSSGFSVTKKGREYDGVIFCPKAMVLLEFKRRLTRAAVQKFLDDQMFDFTREYAEFANGHPLYGAVAGASVDAAAVKLAEKNGLFVIRLPANRRAEVVNDKARPQRAGEK